MIRLKSYFEGRKDVSFALLFGSRANGRANPESDTDIAVYFNGASPVLEIEEAERHFSAEDEIWGDVERIAGTEVDLVVLNRAPAGIAAAALSGGEILSRTDPAIFERYAAACSLLAEEERRFAEEYLEIKARSMSLSEIDRDRLLRIIDFIDSELSDDEAFSCSLARGRYLSDAAFRRNLERWVENLINASIDIAKVVLASQKLPIPQTYREALSRLSIIPGFNSEDSASLAGFSKLRNLLAPEYLDYRYPAIEAFVENGPALFRRLLESVKTWLQKSAE